MDTKLKIILTAWSCALLLFCLSLEATACAMLGQFGSKCQYRCRCTSNKCDNRGQCTGRAKCMEGWFGPACQYVDLVSGRSNFKRITDGNETTCVIAKPPSVTLPLGGSHHFTWLRVHVRRPDFLHDLTVKFNSRLSCTNPRNSSVDDTTLDIYCDLNQRVQNVTLAGKGVQDLCSVYVSGNSTCDSGYYGLECEHKCNCARNEACFVSTGGCPSGCADGFQGFNCDETCDAGKYGNKCGFNCSQFCQLPPNGRQESSCDHVDGTCRHGCQAGYEGNYCLTEQAVIMAGTVAGICVAVAVVLIITIILAVVVCRRRFRRQSPYDRHDNTQQDNYPYIQAGSSEDGYELSSEEISRMRNLPHNVNENNGKHGKTREVPPDSSKVQQDLGGGASNETNKHVYEEMLDDEDNSGGHTGGTYNNI